MLGHFKGKLWNRLPRVHRISWRCRKEKDSYHFRGRFRLEPRRKRPQRSDFFENHRLPQLRFSRLEKFSEKFRRTGTKNSKGLLQIWSHKDKRMPRKGEKWPFLYGIAKWGSSSQTWQATQWYWQLSEENRKIRQWFLQKKVPCHPVSQNTAEFNPSIPTYFSFFCGESKFRQT